MVTPGFNIQLIFESVIYKPNGFSLSYQLDQFISVLMVIFHFHSTFNRTFYGFN